MTGKSSRDTSNIRSSLECRVCGEELRFPCLSSPCIVMGMGFGWIGTAGRGFGFG